MLQHHRRRPFPGLAPLLAWTLSIGLAGQGEPATRESAGRPNIIVIMVDDMGFSDIGAYGSEIPTPNLDALAAGGARFRQFYNTGRCCPTRASLLTGLYSHQAGIGHMTADQKAPGYRGHLNQSCVTMAEVLNGAGYFTAMAGKWHVGHGHGVTPASRGFQRSLNLPAGGVYYPSDSKKCRLFLNGQRIQNDDPRLPENWYGTDLWTDFGIRFLDEAIEKREPYFLYLAHVAPHFPLQAEAEDIARFRGRYKRGWDVLADERRARQRASGLIDEDWRPEPRPSAISAWSKLSATEQDRFDHIMAVYAAVVSRMDASVGRLVDALKQRGVFDDTLILFLSDNGGNAEAGVRGRTKGDPTVATSSWFCGRSWAHLQNVPFSRYKHYNHEGGIASPLIAHWPARIEGSRWEDTPAHVMDLMATCVEVAGAEYPSTYQGRKIQPMEGVSLASLIERAVPLAPRPLFWEHEGNAAIRVGNRKLVRAGGRGPWELYDLAADRTEQNNLVETHADVAADLEARWHVWAKRVRALPKPGKRQRKRK